MGGTSCRVPTALAAATALLAASATGPYALGSSEVAGDGSCLHCAPPPPYDEPAVVIGVDWTHRDRVRLNYWAAPTGSDPYSGASWSGGCDSGAEPLPVEPLVLTQALASGKNLWYEPGSFELVAEAHACLFADDVPEDLSDEGPKHLAVCAEVPSVTVTVSVDDYDAGSSTAAAVLEGPLDPVSVPLYPCDAYPDPQPFRRTLLAFDWDPASGVANPRALVPPASVPDAVDSRAANPGAPSDDSEPARMTSARAVARAWQLIFSWWLALGGEDENDAGDAMAEVLVALADAQSGNSPELQADETTKPRGGPSPPELRPKAKAKFEQQGRVWVKVAKEATIKTGKKKTKNRTLQPEVWYQVRIDSDGGQVFYDQNGKRLGKVPRSDSDRVTVEVHPVEDSDE